MLPESRDCDTSSSEEVQKTEKNTHSFSCVCALGNVVSSVLNEKTENALIFIDPIWQEVLAEIIKDRIKSQETCRHSGSALYIWSVFIRAKFKRYKTTSRGFETVMGWTQGSQKGQAWISRHTCIHIGAKWHLNLHLLMSDKIQESIERSQNWKWSEDPFSLPGYPPSRRQWITTFWCVTLW